MFGRISEASIKTMMVKSVRDAGGYARRIEDQFLVGMPDTIMIPKGCPVFFAEVKIVSGQQLAPSPRQYVEMCRIRAVGGMHGIPIMIGWKDHIYYFHETTEKAPLTSCFSVTNGHMNFHDQLVQFYKGRLRYEK